MWRWSLICKSDDASWQNYVDMNNRSDSVTNVTKRCMHTCQAGRVSGVDVGGSVS